MKSIKMRYLPFLNMLCLLLWFPLSVIAQDLTRLKSSPLDKREYVSITLDNGLKVVVVSDMESNNAGVSLVVGAGSFDNPKEFPGLAHFTEHMLFLGTKKYPIPDEFQKFIQAHSGSYNATTEDEQTSFYFTIEPESFSKALDRFSDFFIAPLFTQELVEREINAVDSEFHMNIQQDSWAALEVFKETSNPEHPFSQFSVGNLQTLGKEKTKLYDALIAFHHKHYRANKMTLALVGPQSVNELIQMAKSHFASIPGHGEPTPIRPVLFDVDHVGLDIYMKSHGERAELNLTFPFPMQPGLERQKAANLLAHLIGYDGQGGLSAVLKDKGWINAMGSNYEHLSKEQGAFAINFYLTPLGLKQIDQITKTTFSYIQLIKEKGVPKHLFDETKKLSQWDFYYIDRQDAGGLAQALATGLQHHTAANLIDSFFMMSQGNFPDNEIKFLLEKLNPNNMRRFVMSREQNTDLVSKWYSVPYRVETLSAQKISQFSNPPRSDFVLPSKNPYIPQKLLVQKGSRKNKRAPQKIKMRAITLWHHQDTEFKKPKADIVINLAYPVAMSTPEKALYTKIYTALASEMLHEKFYPAIVAGANISMGEHARGITLSLNGYTDKQELLLSKILNELRLFKVSESKFLAMKDRMKRGFSNYQHLSLYKRAMTDLNILLSYPSWHPDELLIVSQKVSQENVSKWMAEFWKNCHVEVLIHGNYDQKQAKNFGKIIEREFPAAKIVKPENVTKVVSLGAKTLHYRPVKTTDNNHVALWYLQNPKNDLPTMAKMMLLGNILEVPFFQSLRVEKQLAYALGANAHHLNKVSGMMFWIQSTKAGPQALLSEMKSFLDSHARMIGQLTEKDIEPYRQSLINELREPPQSLGERTQEWWKTIQKGETDFEQAEKLATELEAIKVKDLIRFSQSILSPQTTVGQLFVISTPDGKLAEDKVISSTQAFKDVMAYFVPQAA